MLIWLHSLAEVRRKREEAEAVGMAGDPLEGEGSGESL